MKTRRGFTLLEIILVMTIMLIISALAMPLVFEAMSSDAKVSASADLVRASWNDCRSWAVDEDRPYQFSVLPNSGKFKIEPYHPDGALDPNAPGKVIEGALERGIRFGMADHPVDGESAEADGGEYIMVAVFMPNGTAMQDVEISFGGKNASPITLRLHGFSGTATTVRPGQEEKK